jgi:hypothetical protein
LRDDFLLAYFADIRARWLITTAVFVKEFLDNLLGVG